MKSFGMWYKSATADNERKSKFELHINLWNIKERFTQEEKPFIDFGLYIENFREVDSIVFLIPFKVSQMEIRDLASKIWDTDVARLIFNDSGCVTQSVPNADLHCLKVNGSDNGRLLFNIWDKDKNTWYSGVQLQDGDDYSELHIDLTSLKNSEFYTDYNNLYVRFRIVADVLKKLLFCDLGKRNYYLESGFTATQVIDLKINKERNINKATCQELAGKKYKFMEFGKVHLLIMDSASNVMTDLGNDMLDCRTLEEDEWDNYLEEKYVTRDVLAYHWKKSDSKPFAEYNKLIKIESSKTNKTLIGIYVLVVIALGAAGSGSFEFLNNLFKFFP